MTSRTCKKNNIQIQIAGIQTVMKILLLGGSLPSHSITTEELVAQWSVQLLCKSVEKCMMSYKVNVFNLFPTLSRFSDIYQRQTLPMSDVVCHMAPIQTWCLHPEHC